MKTNVPVKFIEYLQSNFNNQETVEKLLDYLSIIPSFSTEHKIAAVFIGKPRTGKTTLIEILSEIFPKMIEYIPSEILDIRNHHKSTYLTKYKNSGAFVFDSINSHDILDSRKLKMLTGNAKIFARELYQKPEEFIPLAQTILISNTKPTFDKEDNVISDRIITIEFTEEHKKDDPNTKSIEELKKIIRPEIGTIINFLTFRYLDLKKKCVKIRNRFTVSANGNCK